MQEAAFPKVSVQSTEFNSNEYNLMVALVRVEYGTTIIPPRRQHLTRGNFRARDTDGCWFQCGPIPQNYC